ncbi:protein kinase [Desulfovibrio sp. JY]|nr:protein kinase [Desulfovibrio sp. JY]
MSHEYEVEELKKDPLLEEHTVINGKWEILGHIATGGKGEVYLANQVNLDRKVALKIMSRAFLESLEGNEEELKAELDRFRREVKVMARLRHANVLQVFDFDHVIIDGNPLDYIAMEYVPGSTLKLTMPEEGFGDDENRIKHWIRQYFISVLDGVEAIHAAGIIHRDLKPTNVLLDDEVPKIADFGLAGGNFADDITRTHHILGTMPYMPEEQFMDLAMTDARADVYALGKILYEAVIGKLNRDNSPPFKTASLPSPQTPFMKHLDRLIQQATAKDKNIRTPSVKVLRASLRELIGEQGQELPRRTGVRIWIGATVLLLLCLGAGLWYHFAAMQPSNEGPSPAFVSMKSIPGTQGMTVQQEPPIFKKGKPLPKILLGLDEANLRLIPGTSAPAPFYIGETQVTNHQFVEFLRKVQNISVQDGAVMHDGEIWLLLGEVLEGYEPIMYHDGNFVMSPTAASNPVVRVTAFGAAAYARFYGRTLPKKSQWEYAKKEGDRIAGASSGGTANPVARRIAPTTDAAKRTLFPVGDLQPDTLGVRGLGQNVREWVTVTGQAGDLEYHIVGLEQETNVPETHYRRQPWEAFADVGFRTAVTPRWHD